VVGARPDPLEQFPAVVLPPLWPQEANGRRSVLPVLGWWGFPWGLILTPIQVGRNLVGVARPPEASKPSPQLEKVLRIAMARQTVTAAQPKA